MNTEGFQKASPYGIRSPNNAQFWFERSPDQLTPQRTCLINENFRRSIQKKPGSSYRNPMIQQGLPCYP
jgi:hypothetical protein